MSDECNRCGDTGYHHRDGVNLICDCRSAPFPFGKGGTKISEIDERVRTHWVGCWKSEAHHNCAVRMIEDAAGALEPFADALGPNSDEEEWAYTRCLKGEHFDRARAVLKKIRGEG